MILMSTAFKLTASKGKTSLPEFGNIFPLPKIFTEGFLFSKTTLDVKPVGKDAPKLFLIPAFTFTV